MLGPSWIALFKKIPANHHDSIALTLVTGAEIMMQSILRLDEEYAILRGRMAGSTDAAGVIVVPYDQIVNIAFTKRMLDPEAHAIFGKDSFHAAAPIAQPASEPATTAAPEEPAVVEEAPPATAAALALTTGPGKTSPPSKSILLARLRARLAEQGK